MNEVYLESCPACHAPYLCAIACPHNQILTGMAEPVCDESVELANSGDQEFEIAFDEDTALDKPPPSPPE